MSKTDRKSGSDLKSKNRMKETRNILQFWIGFQQLRVLPQTMKLSVRYGIYMQEVEAGY
jgi:hypothetical protein